MSDEGRGLDTERCPEPSDAQLVEASLVDGRYEIAREMDRDAERTLYLARDVFLERSVCLKVVAPEHIARPEAASRLRREAAALAAVTSEHVARVYACGPCGDTLYLAMEHVVGHDLREIIDEHLRLGTSVALTQALSILRRIAAGLSDVHSAGLVHRDVTPANILIETVTGRPVLVDFGLAVPADLVATEDTEPIGTPEYMAPEQIAPARFGPIGPATDVYALACTAFALLTGHPPFRGPSTYAVLSQQTDEPAPLPSSLRADLGPLDAVLLRALQKRPEERYPSAVELCDAFERVRTHRASAIPPPPPDDDDDSPTQTIVIAETTGVDRRLPEEGRARDPMLPLRILVVADDPELRDCAVRASRIALFGQRVKIKAVRSAAAALEDAEKLAPDLVLLDHDTPDLDGLETLGRLRDEAGAAAARVLVMGEQIGSGERWIYGTLGIDGVLAKPAVLEQLVSGIADIARRARWIEPGQTDATSGIDTLSP